MVRTPCCDNNNNLSGLKKGPWTPEEDRILVEYIRQHGHGCWRALPSKAGLLRCGKSCRLRWTNYLRPDIKRGNFSSEEEQTIVRLHAALGNKWSVIAGHLPGRTDNEIKNYWNTRLKKRLLQMGIDPVTHGPALDANSLTSSFNLAPCQMTGSWDNGRLEDESSGGLISRDRYLRLVAAAAAAYSVLMFENHYPDLCNMSSSCRNPLSEYLNYCASFAPTLPADYGAVLPLMSLQQYILEQNTNNFPSIHTEDGFPIVEDLLIAGAASESCDQRKKNIVKEDCNSLLSTILQESVLFNSRDEALSNSTPAAATQYCRVEEQLLSAVMKDEPKLFTTYSSSHEITNTLSYPDIVSDNNSMDSNCGYGESLPPELLYNQGLHCNTALPPQSEIMTNIVSYLSSGAR